MADDSLVVGRQLGDHTELRFRNVELEERSAIEILELGATPAVRKAAGSGLDAVTFICEPQ